MGPRVGPKRVELVIYAVCSKIDGRCLAQSGEILLKWMSNALRGCFTEFRGNFWPTDRKSVV